MLLAIDTSTKQAGIALYDGARGLIAEYNWHSANRHTEELMPAVAQMLAQASVKPSGLRAVAVALGPGSFTGLRVGLAAAKGLALAQWPDAARHPDAGHGRVSPPGAAGAGGRRAPGRPRPGLLGALCARTGRLGRPGAAPPVNRARVGEYRRAPADVRRRGVDRGSRDADQLGRPGAGELPAVGVEPAPSGLPGRAGLAAVRCRGGGRPRVPQPDLFAAAGRHVRAGPAAVGGTP